MEERIKWLNTLLDYAEGKKKWDTGCIWVCESHPRLPFEMGTTFDCKCGGPGMPPYSSIYIKRVEVCPDCGGKVTFYHEKGGITRIVCKDKCQGWKVL